MRKSFFILLKSKDDLNFPSETAYKINDMAREQTGSKSNWKFIMEIF